MNIKILKIKDDEYFILNDKDNKMKISGRCGNIEGILNHIGEITGNVIEIEQYPLDYLYKFLSEKNKS
jgi:hypothetical protein